MKLHLSNPAGLNLFSAYGDGYVAVNKEKHAINLIVLPESIIFEWSTATPATLAESDMQKLLELGDRRFSIRDPEFPRNYNVMQSLRVVAIRLLERRSDKLAGGWLE